MVTQSDRPQETVRDEVIDRLVSAYGHGHLSLEAFERRLDAAYDLDQAGALEALAADLPAMQEKAAPVEAQPREEHVARTDGDIASGTVIAIFGGSQRKGPWHVPANLRVVTLFGGAELDFAEATFSAQTTRVQVLCLFGGVDIRVPATVRAVARAIALFGGVDDKSGHDAAADGPTIIVDGLVMFGGVSIKPLRRSRDRALRRASRLRERMERASRR